MYHVIKFGGTSVANIDRIRHVAHIILENYTHNTIVVVSAMAGMTDHLAHDMSSFNLPYYSDAHDMVMSSGEPISTGFLCLALQELGIKAQPFLGWQVPIMTDAHHQKARIRSINIKSLLDCLSEGIIPVVAGFQGVSSRNRITTLGRGGSDTTAVAIAAALKGVCTIYTDVNGVYTADPRIVAGARHIKELNADIMLEMASNGAKVLHARSIDIAIKHNVPIYVRSSFTKEEGTYVMPTCQDMDDYLEGPRIQAVVQQKQIVSICAQDANLNMIGRLLEQDIPLHMIQSTEHEVQFWVHEADIASVRHILANDIYDEHANMAQLSLIGQGLRDSGLTGKALAVLAQHNIAIHGLSVNNMSIAVILSADDVAPANRLWHQVFIEEKNPVAA